MLWLALSAVLSGAPDAGALTAEAREALIQEARSALTMAEARAGQLSRAGKYADAATTLENMVRGLDPRLSADDLERLVPRPTAAAAEYRRRAQAAAKAGTDKGQARALLSSLLDGKVVETADPTDPRVQALLGGLRELDPSVKALFGPRKLKVVIIGTRLTGPLERTYAEALVKQLRVLGLEASTEVGDERFEVAVSEGPVLDVGAADGLGISAGVKMISCELVGQARWVRADGSVEFDQLGLNARGGGFPDLPDNCLKKQLPRSAALAPLALLRAWIAR